MLNNRANQSDTYQELFFLSSCSQLQSSAWTPHRPGPIRSTCSSTRCWRAGRTEGRPGVSTSRSCSCCSPAAPRFPAPTAAAAAGSPRGAEGLSFGWEWSGGRRSAWAPSEGRWSARCRCRGNSHRRPWPGWRWRWRGSDSVEDGEIHLKNTSNWDNVDFNSRLYDRKLSAALCLYFYVLNS